METTISLELKSHFLRLYQIAIADENFSKLELKMLYKFAEDRNIPGSELDNILLSTFDKLAVPEDLRTKVEYLYDLACMILADNVIMEEEVVVLKKYCKSFGFLEENIEELAQYMLENAEKGTSKKDIINELN